MSYRYGHTVKDDGDVFVRLIKDASATTSEAAVPGAFMVDLFPSRESENDMTLDHIIDIDLPLDSQVRSGVDAWCWVQAKSSCMAQTRPRHDRFTL